MINYNYLINLINLNQLYFNLIQKYLLNYPFELFKDSFIELLNDFI
jgi:hypothetical protein